MSGAGPVHELAALLAPGAVSSAPADLLAASTDLWPRHILGLWRGRVPVLPLAVAWPESIADLQTLVGFARERGLALVPYGAGSSVVGGATSDPDTIVVDLKRMARILGIDAEARTATAEAGIMGELLERTLERAGLTQGHFPSSIYCSTLGGWIAARGAGQMSSRYGKIEDQVLGGAVVLGDGTLVRQRPAPIRTPLLDALIGSEGTLGIWAEATVRVHPLPETRAFRGLDFATLADALAGAEAWLRAGLTPAVVRIYDPVDTILHRDTSARQVPHDRGPSRTAWAGARFPRLIGALADTLSRRCRAIIGLQGDADVVARELAVLLEVARQHQGVDLGPEPGEAWWRTRYRVSYRQSNAFRAGVAVDTMEVACTWDRVLPVYEAVRRAGRAAGAQVLAHFSHVYLDGASIYFTYALPARGGEAAYDRMWEGCLAAAAANGGNVSHHHGIGRLKGAAFRRALGGGLALLRAQSAALDPSGILNPAVLGKKAAGPEPAAGAALAPRAHPAAGALVTTAVPEETLASVEERLAQRGLTLGPAAVLVPGLRVIDAARRGFLWRKSPQLQVAEPVVMGIDGAVAGEPVRYVPAPRAAMGSEPWRALLDAEVERVWLRCLPRSEVRLEVRGAVGDCLASARRVARDEALGGTALTLRARGNEAVLRLEVAPGPLAETRVAALRELVGARVEGGDVQSPLAAGPLASGGGAPPVGPLVAGSGSGEEVVGFAGLWDGVEHALAELRDHDVALAVVDGAGVMGLVGSRARGVLARLGLELSVERSAPDAGGGGTLERRAEPGSRPDRRPDGTGAQERARRASADAVAPRRLARRTLTLGGLGNQLDNCTYCPKLCRFACPVAVADGSETLTPRQLMLTASLDRRGARALGTDEALRLYSCVDCRGCRSFCDHDNDVGEVLMQARAELAAAGATPEPIREVLAAFARDGAPPGAQRRLPLPEGDGRAAGTWLFFGCQHEAGDEPVLAATHAFARERLGAVHVPDLAVRCCGHPLWRWGDREGFARHARRFAEQLVGVERLVVDDPGCAYALRELYPRVGVALPAVVTTSSLIAAGELRVSEPGRLVPHDDEWAVRWLGEPTLRERFGVPLARGSVLEGEAGSCGGMLLPYYDARLADAVARGCAEDLLGGGADTVVTASPSCRRRLRAAGVPVVDVLELWAHGRG